MNILVYAPQMAAFGGMERHICDLARALAARGHRVELITTSNSLGTPLRTALAASRIALRELPVSRGRAGALRKATWLLVQALRAKRTPWDVIYTNGQSALARLVWIAAGAPTRVIHHHHTAADLGEQATWSPWFRRVLKNAPEVVACSQATQRAIAAAVARDDIHYLPYLTACPLDAALVADRTYLPGSRLNFGFVGRLVKEKGIALICALSQRPELADIAWHIHGSGQDFPPEHFTAFPNVTYHGPYSTAVRHAEILQSLDVLVLFSIHNEGMPLSLIESMSAGLPWIATNRGGTREAAVSPANALVIEPTDNLSQLSVAVRAMADRLRTGLTSRRAQRHAYDLTFAPATVARAWCDYFERTAPPAGKAA